MAKYAPPEGFTLDPSSGKYYRTAQITGANGEPLRHVTWFDPEAGSYTMETEQLPGNAEPLKAPPLPPVDFSSLPPLDQRPMAAKGPSRKKAGRAAPLMALAILLVIGAVAGGVFWLKEKSQAPAPANAQGSSMPKAEGAEPSGSSAAATANRVDTPALTEGISVEIACYNDKTADVYIKNLHFQESYPTQVDGLPEGYPVYSYGVSWENAFVQLAYFRHQEEKRASVTPKEMYGDFFVKTSENHYTSSSFRDVYVVEDGVVFTGIKAPTDLNLQFDQPGGISLEVNEGLESSYRQLAPQIIPPDALSKTVGVYHCTGYGDNSISLDLQPEGKADLTGNMNGGNLSIPGKYTLTGDNRLLFFPSKDYGKLDPHEYLEFSYDPGQGLYLKRPAFLYAIPADGLFQKIDMAGGEAGEDGGSTSPQSGSTPDAANLIGEYVCTIPDMTEEYLPVLRILEGEKFSMRINGGEGMMEANGIYTWTESEHGLLLSFQKINGGPPTPERLLALVRLQPDGSLKFATEGFGLMGYDEATYGVFRKR